MGGEGGTFLAVFFNTRVILGLILTFAFNYIEQIDKGLMARMNK